MSNFKYFSDKEIAGLITPLPAMLDKARALITADKRIKDPRMILTSTTGGTHAPNSTHPKGLAVDIGTGHLSAGPDRDSYQGALVKALYDSGFERVELCPAHVHADIGAAPEYLVPWLAIGRDA